MDGWAEYEPTEDDVGREMVLYDYIVDRSKIPEYFDEDTLAMIQFWQTYKKYGFPHGGGWADQPAVHMEIISLLDGELSKRNKNARKR